MSMIGQINPKGLKGTQNQTNPKVTIPAADGILYSTGDGKIDGAITIGSGLTYSGTTLSNNLPGITPGTSGIQYYNTSSSTWTALGVPSSNTSVAIGSTGAVAITTGLRSVSLGNGASCGAFNDAVAIGWSSSSTSVGATSIGRSSNGNNSQTTAIGINSTCNGSNSTAIGVGASSSGANSTAIGMFAETLESNSVCMGSTSIDDFVGEMNFCNAKYAVQGDIHNSFFIYKGITTTTTPVELMTGNSSQGQGFIALTIDSSYAFTLNIVAHVNGGTSDRAMWSSQFLIYQVANAASTTIVRTPTGLTSPLFATTGAITGAWSVAITADTTNGRPSIIVTGQSATTIRWAASIQMVKIT